MSDGVTLRNLETNNHYPYGQPVTLANRNAFFCDSTF